MKQLLPEKIMKEIEKQGMKPRPRWQFLLKNWVLWLCITLSVLLGGVAIAIIIFTFVDHDTMTRVYLQETVFEDVLKIVPYFWLATLAFLIGITKYAVRHTTFGYRYTTWHIINMALLGSAVLGIALQATETAERIQDFLTEQTPFYDKLTDNSKDAWSHPENGVLGGTVSAMVSLDEFELTDFQGKTWLVDFSRIEKGGEVFIRPGSIVRIIGSLEDESTFRSTHVWPWKE